MSEYHKIQSIYKREREGKRKLIIGDYSLPEFELLKDIEWEWTEKLDGTNIRVKYHNGGFAFCGRTDKSIVPKLLYNNLNNHFFYLSHLFNYYFKQDNVCLYGEGIGVKIQNGGNYYKDDQKFVLFDIKINDSWLSRNDVNQLANNFNLQSAPIIKCGSLIEAVNFVKKGFNSSWGDFLAEGIVARPKIELKTKNGYRIITKIKHKDF